MVCEGMSVCLTCLQPAKQVHLQVIQLISQQPTSLMTCSHHED